MFHMKQFAGLSATRGERENLVIPHITTDYTSYNYSSSLV